MRASTPFFFGEARKQDVDARMRGHDENLFNWRGSRMPLRDSGATSSPSPLLDLAGGRWHLPGGFCWRRPPVGTCAERGHAMKLKTFLSRFFTWWNGQTF